MVSIRSQVNEQRSEMVVMKQKGKEEMRAIRQKSENDFRMLRQ